MKLYNALSPVLIGVTIILIQPQVSMALSSAEVGKIAKKITVLIEHSKAPGSGVILSKEGNTYTVITAAHVVAKPDNYAIVTSDSLRYQVNYKTVRRLPDVDLAVVQFTSNVNYNVAKIGNSNESTEGRIAYIAGFPKATAAISRPVYSFVEGKITANASKALKEGYALVYSNDTLPGMSGGAVLNEKGELIGIHGRADTSTENLKFSDINPNIAIKTGFNLGIPINTFLRVASNVGVNLGISAPPLIATAPKADDFYIQGSDKLFKKGDYQGAIADLTEAIRLNPNNANTYTARSYARRQLKDLQGAIADINQAIKINPNDANPYKIRGFLRFLFNDWQGGIADFSQVIKINPKDISGYVFRGIFRYQLKDWQGVMVDFNQVIKINPKNAMGYIMRGSSRYQLKDWQGAMADFDQGIKIDPKNAIAYRSRGLARTQLKDLQGAITDFDQAIRFNDVEAYSLRGFVRLALKNLQGAIADFDQAIKINSNNAAAYSTRGIIRARLGDKQQAIADLQKAADLFLQQGNTELYQQTLELIRQLQQ